MRVALILLAAAMLNMATAMKTDIYPLVIPGNTTCPISYVKMPSEAFVASKASSQLLISVINEGVKQKIINTTCLAIAQAHLPQCLNDLSLQDGCCDANCANSLLLADNSTCTPQFMRTFCNIQAGVYFQFPMFNTWLRCLGKDDMSCESFKLASPPGVKTITTTTTTGSISTSTANQEGNTNTVATTTPDVAVAKNAAGRAAAGWAVAVACAVAALVL